MGWPVGEKTEGTSSGRKLLSEESLGLQLWLFEGCVTGQEMVAWEPGLHLTPPPRPASALAGKGESPDGGHRPCGNSSVTLAVTFL